MHVSSLFQAAYDSIITTSIESKIALTRETVQAWRADKLTLDDTPPVESIPLVGQPPQLRLVAPRDLPQRRINSSEGIFALLHAIAHIEFNAINLAWDAVYRFRTMPRDFYDDWVQVADEEATHFLLLRNALQTRGHDYGELPAHNGLWSMAVETDHDVMVRMALVPRVLEARGLDATPPIIKKLDQQGETALVEILQVILRDEVGHVAIGSRWFHYCCVQRGLNPETTFTELLRQYYRSTLRPPFNVEARLQAGFSNKELDNLEKL